VFQIIEKKKNQNNQKQLKVLEKEIIHEAKLYLENSKTKSLKTTQDIDISPKEITKARISLLYDAVSNTTQDYSPEYNPDDEFELIQGWSKLDYPFSENEKKYFHIIKIQSLKKEATSS